MPLRNSIFMTMTNNLFSLLLNFGFPQMQFCILTKINVIGNKLKDNNDHTYTVKFHSPSHNPVCVAFLMECIR
jgi:hypothetical protein